MNLPCVQEHASGVPTGRAKAKKTSPGFPGAGLRELELALEHVVRCLLPIALAASLSCKTPIHRLDYESAKAFFCLVTDDPEGQEAWQLVAGETALDASDVALRCARSGFRDMEIQDLWTFHGISFTNSGFRSCKQVKERRWNSSEVKATLLCQVSGLFPTAWRGLSGLGMKQLGLEASANNYLNTV